jgi:hypothetical protein
MKTIIICVTYRPPDCPVNRIQDEFRQKNFRALSMNKPIFFLGDLSYLSVRSQYVRIGSTVSSTSALTHGVPQGYILSPFLFGIYVNDLPAVAISSDLDSYVDDSKLHLAFLVEDVQQTIAKLENDVYKTAKWCLEHQLLINPDKTKFLLVGTRSMLQNLPTQINLNFLGKTVKTVSVARDLGMHLDLHLSYDDHISKLSSTCINKLCQISRVKESFDKKNFNITY